MRPPAGQALRLKIELAAPALRHAASTYWLSGDPRQRYVAYAAAMHAVIRASVPLMELAAARCDALGSADPVAARTGAYLRAHIGEERGHDDWLAADLRLTGTPGAEALLAGAPGSPAVAALAGAQYYWIRHYHPVALLGYIGALEHTGPSQRMTRWLADATGFPHDAFRTLEEHAHLDQRHSGDLFALVDQLDVTGSQAAAIGCSALHAIAGLGAVFTSLTTATCQEQHDVHPRA
jgi:hypothetical protein